MCLLDRAPPAILRKMRMSLMGYLGFDELGQCYYSEQNPLEIPTAMSVRYPLSFVGQAWCRQYRQLVNVPVFGG